MITKPEPRLPPVSESIKFMCSGGSTVARLKLKGIDGMTPQGVDAAA